MRRLVFICSPFSGDIELNRERAQRFMLFAIRRGVAPVAPHLLYPQVLDEDNPPARELGILVGLDLLRHCDEVWVLGPTISDGMLRELELAQDLKKPIVHYRPDSDGGDRYAAET